MADKPRIEAEMLVAVSAVVIGVCALFVSVYETSLMRKEQRAAVMPLIELARSHFTSDDASDQAQWRLSLLAENVGIGPARVLDFRVTVDDEPHRSWDSALKALIDHDGEIRYGHSTINGRTIPPDRQVVLFDLDDTSLTASIVSEFDRLDYEACYCSIFDECWKTSYSRFGTAARVPECTRSDDSFRQ